MNSGVRSRQDDDVKGRLAWRLTKVSALALVLWIGETLIGLIPLMGHAVVTGFAKHLVQIAHCNLDMTNCRAVEEALPIAEINIISVVTCGLGLLTFVKFGPSARYHRTPMTYLAGVAALGLLILASFLYALASAGIAANDAGVTVWVLVFSLAVSLYLAIEEAMLHELQRA